MPCFAPSDISPPHWGPGHDKVSPGSKHTSVMQKSGVFYDFEKPAAPQDRQTDHQRCLSNFIITFRNTKVIAEGQYGSSTYATADACNAAAAVALWGGCVRDSAGIMASGKSME